MLFYLGHLEAFDWNLLWRDARSRPSKHAAWEQLFAFGIDPVDGQFPTDTPDDWPALDAVKSLPEAYRETLVLRLVEGLSGPEIAERTGLTPASVRVNLHRGMKLLREKLGAPAARGEDDDEAVT